MKRSISHPGRAIWLFALFVVSVAGAARGELVTVHFSGTLRVYDDYRFLPAEFETGNSFSGTLTYDTEADPISGKGGLPFDYTLFIGGREFSPTGSIDSNIMFVDNGTRSLGAPIFPRFENDPPLEFPNTDWFFATSDISIPALSFTEWTRISFSGVDHLGELFSLDHLADGFTFRPGQEIGFQMHSYSDIWFSYLGHFPPGFSVVGTIDNLYSIENSSNVAAQVPEPSGLALMCTVALGALFVAARNRRSNVGA